MIKCLIIDDEPLAADVIKTYLASVKNLQLANTFSSAVEAYDYVSENSVDLMFLDINMPDMTGLEFLKSLKNPPHIIITTAYREFAVDAFELDVVDYLVKPIALPRFLHAVEKAKNLIENNPKPGIHAGDSSDKYVLLKVDKKIVRLDLNDIYFIESLKDYIRVKTKIGNFTTHQTLTTISELLPEDRFVRIHRSFTISLDMVTALIGNSVEVNGQLIPIGRNYLGEVKQKVLNSGISGIKEMKTQSSKKEDNDNE